MKLQDWVKSELEYSQDLVHSAVEGARFGCRRAGVVEPARSLFADAARNSLPLAAIGACVIPLAARLTRGRKRRNEALLGLLGAAIGFGAGIAFTTRPLMEEMAHEAVHNINGVREAHWLEQHPIDYA